MVFEKFGKINFTPHTKVGDFATFLKEGKLKGTKCKHCNTLYFPPRADCTKCMKSDVEWVELTGKGRLVTYTTIYAAPTGFELEAPYTVAVVALQEGEKLLAWLENLKEEDLKIGMELQVVPKQLDNEKVVYVIKTK